MKPILLLTILALASGCTAPAVVSVPPPAPLAVGPAGLSVSGGLGSSTTFRGRVQGTAVVRPAPDVGFFASGMVARGGFSRDEPGDIRESRHRYAEIGAMGALPLSETAWLTGSLARGGGVASGEGRGIGLCTLTCSGDRFDVRADFARTAAYAGLHLQKGEGTGVGIGLRFARIAYRNVTEEHASLLEAVTLNDFTVSTLEPVFALTFPTRYGSFDLTWTNGAFQGEVPQITGISGGDPKVASEGSSLTAGVTVSLWR